MPLHGCPLALTLSTNAKHKRDDAGMNALIRYSMIYLILLASSACQQQVDSSDTEFQVPVRVAKVGLANLERRIVAGGSLRPKHVATLTVGSPGLISIAQGENGALGEGAYVKAGDVLASIRGEDLRLALKRAAVKQRLDSATTNLGAIQQLIDKKLTSVAEYNHLKDVLEEAKLEYQKSLNIESQSNIRTPISGVILDYFRDENGQRMANGQRVEVGDEVAKVAPLDTLIADIQLVSSDIAQVHKGVLATISTYIWDNETFDGEVVQLAPSLDAKTRTMKAQVSANNRDGMLKPGMYVRVTLVLERKESVVAVPSSAITQRGGRKVVFVQRGQRVEQRDVSLGIRQDEQVEILSGVESGESVVVLGLETLADQMPIQVERDTRDLFTSQENFSQ